MNAEEDSLRGKQRQAINQTTVMVPYFDEEMSVLYLADGTAYLPVRSLCCMLSLRAQTHIPWWQKLDLWSSARKLPLQTARCQRIVWCLQLGALPFWCVCFNWSVVPAERREQLRQATDAWQEDVAHAQRLLLERYRSLRRHLFAFLEDYSDPETWLDRWALHVSSSLDVASSRQLELLLSQGKTLIGEATGQAMAPIMDIVTIGASGEVVKTHTLPFFPVVPHQDREQFFAHRSKLALWYQVMAAFVSSLKLLLNDE
jgi:hypothetical protein